MSKTVFVIGAGASAEVGLPVGSVLKATIAGKLNFQWTRSGLLKGDPVLHDALRHHVQLPNGSSGDVRPYFEASQHLALSLPLSESIDHKVYSDSENEPLVTSAKLAIAQSILEAEKASALSFDPSKTTRLAPTAGARTWYRRLFRLLTLNCKKDLGALAERLQRVTLIVFNYDRCIEHYLFHQFCNAFGLTDAQAAELLPNLAIYHPYGTVGSLPWSGRSASVRYGEILRPDRLLKASAGIRTFSEGTADGRNISTIRESLSNGSDIVFLGYAYHRINQQLLFGENVGADEWRVRIFGTTEGLSDPDARSVAEDFQIRCGRRGKRNALKDRLHLSRLKCSEFLDAYSRRLELD